MKSPYDHPHDPITCECPNTALSEGDCVKRAAHRLQAVPASWSLEVHTAIETARMNHLRNQTKPRFRGGTNV